MSTERTVASTDDADSAKLRRGSRRRWPAVLGAIVFEPAAEAASG